MTLAPSSANCARRAGAAVEMEDALAVEIRDRLLDLLRRLLLGQRGGAVRLLPGADVLVGRLHLPDCPCLRGQGEAAVDDQRVPPDHLGVRRAEERDDTGDVLGRDQSPRRRPSVSVLEHPLAVREVLQRFGLDDAGRYCVDADARSGRARRRGSGRATPAPPSRSRRACSSRARASTPATRRRRSSLRAASAAPPLERGRAARVRSRSASTPSASAASRAQGGSPRSPRCAPVPRAGRAPRPARARGRS